MSRLIVPSNLQMHRLTFEQAQWNLRREFGDHWPKTWKDDLYAFAREYDVPLGALVKDARRRSLPVVTEVALIADHRFVFARDVTEPAALHNGLVFPVRNAPNQWLDLAVIVPEVNKAAVLLGTKGILGCRQLSSRTAQRGVRVYRDPLQYLRDGRHGVLIIDPVKAAYDLRCQVLRANSLEHARELGQLGLSATTVVISPQKRHR